MSAFRIEDAVLTHVGHVRQENEDSLSRQPDQGIWVVADGMGGHHNGSFASQAITSSVSAARTAADLEQTCLAVAAAVHQANAQIWERAQEVGKQMGSTVVCLVLQDQDFAVLWAGDSRAYLFREGQLIRLTRDHTQVEDMLERGLLTPAEAADHPMKHVLSRAVGVQPALEIDAIRDRVVSRDLFLLCSDGLYGVLSDEEIAEALRARGQAACDDLVAACLARGAPDNVTVAIVAASEPTLLILNGATL